LAYIIGYAFLICVFLVLREWCQRSKENKDYAEGDEIQAQDIKNTKDNEW
jgi:hypothetical protein